MIVLLGACLGLIGSFGLAFFFGFLDNTLKTPEEVERLPKLRNLGSVPDFLHLDSQCSVDTDGFFCAHSQRSRHCFVTVINTAIHWAQMGARVLVIDADLRRPSCHRGLQPDKGVGLRELSEIIRNTSADNGRNG